MFGTCRSSVWLSHITQLMKEARLVLLEEECQSVRTKTKTSKSGEACRICQEQGSFTGAGEPTAVLLTLFSTDSPEKKHKLTSSSSMVKLKHVKFELCCTRIEVEWRTFCFYACTEI